ncbi:MAG TPA: UPF0175 family protein [Blastocatellia bacterium]|nr:UPF0175 family protein [Blastocatellia bacterium]
MPNRVFGRHNNEARMMNTSEMKISLPPTLSEDEARLLFAVKLFEVGKVSLGQAAKLAGFSRRAFMEVLGRYKVPIFNYSPEELREETSL